MRRRWKVGLAVLGLALLAVLGYVVYLRAQVVPPAALPIAHDTTRLLDPLDAEGQVDYAAALAARAFPPAAENGALPILRVVGTDALEGDVATVLARLGAPDDVPAARGYEPLPEELEYFEPLEELDTEARRAGRWAWIERNKAALGALVEAGRRPHLRWPLAREPEVGRLTSALGPADWMGLVRILRTRSDLLLVEGRATEAWRDEQLTLALAQRLGASPTLLERVVATSMHRHPYEWLGEALAAGALDAAACEAVHRTLAPLHGPRGIDGEVLETERLLLLDAYIRIVRQSIRADGNDPDWHPANVALAAALREINRQFDRFRSLLDEPIEESLPRLEAELEALRADMRELTRELDTMGGQAEHVARALATGGAHQGRIAGRALALTVLSLVPAVGSHARTVETHRQLVLVALALKQHERRTGAFPALLSDVEPGAIPDLANGPLDLADVTYERDAQGCLLEHAAIGLELRVAGDKP